MTEQERSELLLLRRLARTTVAFLANPDEHRTELAELCGEWSRFKAQWQSGRPHDGRGFPLGAPR